MRRTGGAGEEEEEVAGRGLSSRAAAALAGRRWVRRARARGEARVQEEGHAGRGAWRLGVCAPMRAVSCQRWGGEEMSIPASGWFHRKINVFSELKVVAILKWKYVRAI